MLSRAEHDKLTSNTLVRKRTAAKDYSIANGRGSGGKGHGGEIAEAKKMAAAAKRESAAAPMASDGLPMPSYSSSNHSSPIPSPQAKPQALPESAGRFGSPRQDQRPLPAGQQPLPGGPGKFGRRDESSGSSGRVGGPTAGRFSAAGRQPEDRRNYSPNRRQDGPTSSSPPTGGFSVPQASSGGRRQEPLSQPQRRPEPAAGRHGQSFALSDDGPSSKPSSGAASAKTQPSTPSTQSPQSKPAAATVLPPQKGPATFAEMGFHSAPVQDKDCIIM